MTKRFLSVLIALVMVVALAVPAFAATPETSSPVDERMFLCPAVAHQRDGKPSGGVS